jgi:hypothetical protein
LDYYNVLSDTYQVDTWSTATDGYPTPGDILEYDALIWTTGDYWDDSVGAEGAELLSQYVEVGGNLILSGASIAFDWEHTDFLAAVPHAEYQGFGEQVDLEIDLMDHPLSKGLVDRSPIEFVEGPSGELLPIDIVSNTSDARTVFRRGFDSEEPGAASVIAFEDNRTKVAYFAFPVYLLPDDAKTQLINNTVNWFRKKPLPLPGGEDYSPFEPDEDEAPADEDTGEEPDEDTGQDNGEDENGNGDNGNND